MWRYREKAEMARQAFEKYAEMPPAVGSTPGEIRGEPGRPDPVRRSVASIAAGNFYATSGSTLPRGTSFVSVPYRSLTNDTRK